jgi:hypothetical protein
MVRKILGILLLVAVVLQVCPAHAVAAECDEFVVWVHAAKNAYMQNHQVYPVPADIQQLAKRYMPRIWVHPDSWQPISFNHYLSHSRLVSRSDDRTLLVSPGPKAIAALKYTEQCSTFLEAPDIEPAKPAPLYVQVFKDRSPTRDGEEWIYIKYNPVFDWSGLAHDISWLAALGSTLAGGDRKRWHRLDVHTAAILAFDGQRKLRLLTLAQHNHQHTYISGKDFPAGQGLLLAAAFQSNELYLDRGESEPVQHRVVPFFNKVSYLIDPEEKPWLWAIDLVYGRHAGGKEVELYPVFLEPKHPLADFAGFLAPPRKMFGIYTGRDGPPGYNYYAPPDYFSMPDFIAMGYWQAGNKKLLAELSPFLKGLDDTDWDGLLNVFRQHLMSGLKASPWEQSLR